MQQREKPEWATNGEVPTFHLCHHISWCHLKCKTDSSDLLLWRQRWFSWWALVFWRTFPPSFIPICMWVHSWSGNGFEDKLKNKRCCEAAAAEADDDVYECVRSFVDFGACRKLEEPAKVRDGRSTKIIIRMNSVPLVRKFRTPWGSSCLRLVTVMLVWSAGEEPVMESQDRFVPLSFHR